MSKDLLYSPWRLSYIISEKGKNCVFCFDPADDEKHLVVYRSQFSFVILNLYPYNNGHIMVVSNKHISSLNELDLAETQDIFETVRLCESVLKSVYNPEGINIGINLGKAAGAGIDDHLHIHLVPRWSGDCNFMTSISGTRMIPEDFEVSAKRLRDGFGSR
jgi:ATP adenylyltransferase